MNPSNGVDPSQLAANNAAANAAPNAATNSPPGGPPAPANSPGLLKRILNAVSYALRQIARAFCFWNWFSSDRPAGFSDEVRAKIVARNQPQQPPALPDPNRVVVINVQPAQQRDLIVPVVDQPLPIVESSSAVGVQPAAVVNEPQDPTRKKVQDFLIDFIKTTIDMVVKRELGSAILSTHDDLARSIHNIVENKADASPVIVQFQNNSALLVDWMGGDIQGMEEVIRDSLQQKYPNDHINRQFIEPIVRLIIEPAPGGATILDQDGAKEVFQAALAAIWNERSERKGSLLLALCLPRFSQDLDNDAIVIGQELTKRLVDVLEQVTFDKVLDESIATVNEDIVGFLGQRQTIVEEQKLKKKQLLDAVKTLESADENEQPDAAALQVIREGIYYVDNTAAQQLEKNAVLKRLLGDEWMPSQERRDKAQTEAQAYQYLQLAEQQNRAQPLAANPATALSKQLFEETLNGPELIRSLFPQLRLVKALGQLVKVAPAALEGAAPKLIQEKLDKALATVCEKFVDPSRITNLLVQSILPNTIEKMVQSFLKQTALRNMNALAADFLDLAAQKTDAKRSEIAEKIVDMVQNAFGEFDNDRQYSIDFDSDLFDKFASEFVITVEKALPPTATTPKEVVQEIRKHFADRPDPNVGMYGDLVKNVIELGGLYGQKAYNWLLKDTTSQAIVDSLHDLRSSYRGLTNVSIDALNNRYLSTEAKKKHVLRSDFYEPSASFDRIDMKLKDQVEALSALFYDTLVRTAENSGHNLLGTLGVKYALGYDSSILSKTVTMVSNRLLRVEELNQYRIQRVQGIVSRHLTEAKQRLAPPRPVNVAISVV